MCIMATVGLKCPMNDTGVYSEVKFNGVLWHRLNELGGSIMSAQAYQ